MATNPFNPAAFSAKKQVVETQKEKLPYEVTGNSSRDNIRKVLWEILSGEPDGSFKNSDLVHKIEEEIHSSTGSDAKSRQYRDKVKQLQLKIKGPRFGDTRQSLRDGSLEIPKLCTDEFLNAKAAPASAPMGRGMPSARGRGGPPGVGPPGLGRGRGAPMGRGRGGPMLPGQARPGLPAASPRPPTQDETKQEQPDQKPEEILEEPLQAPEVVAEEPKEVQPEPEVAKPPVRPPSENRPLQMAPPAEEKPKVTERQPSPAAPQQPITRGPPAMARGMPPGRGRGGPPGLGRGGPPGLARGGPPGLARGGPGRGPPRPPIVAQTSVAQPAPEVEEKKDVTPEAPAEVPIVKDPFSKPSTEEADASKIELEFPDDSILTGKGPEDSKIEEPALSERSSSSSQPVIGASLDDSQLSHRSLVKKKKKKGKKKKVVPQAAVEEIKEAIIEAVEEKKIEIIQEQKVETSPRPATPPKEEEKMPEIKETSKPKELTNEELQELMASKKKAAPLGKLTKENLEQQFREQRSTPKFDENDIETESIMMLDQSMAGSRMNSPRGIAQSTMSFQVEERKVSKTDQVMPKVATTKSKSLTQSQNAGQESENTRRLQEALQSKKDLNNDLNQKLLNLQSEQTLQNQKQDLILEENNALREELRKLKREQRQQNDHIQQINQQSAHKDQIHQRQMKERDDALNQMSQEIDHLKQERDTYKDRLQRALRDSLQQREQLERSISSQGSSNIISNIRQLGGSLATLSSPDPPNTTNPASNQQEINLQKEINELRIRYEKQLRDQRHELAMRTRDLQKVERKNIKYRENNRILSDAVQSLENRNITSAAGSGGNQNEVYVSYQHIIRETTEDMIETMPDNDESEIIYEQQIEQQEHDVIRPRADYQFSESNFVGSGGYSNVEGQISASGLFNHNSELNSGEHGQTRRPAAVGGGGYFDNAQDEATGGEGHSNLTTAFEEEKSSPNQRPDHQFDQQSAEANNQDLQNNNQSAIEATEPETNAFMNDGTTQGSSARAG